MAGLERAESESQDEMFDKPNHPDPRVMPDQQLPNKTLRFQEKWFRDYAWLHYSPIVKGVLCFYCMQAFRHQSSALAKSMEPVFVCTGFRNWKKALDKFSSHQQSQAHKVAMTAFLQQRNSVSTQLSTAKEQQQRESRSCLVKIFKSARFLARQGLALRGHGNDEGNFKQLLQLQAEDDEVLKRWLSKPTNTFTSGDIQNEILSLMANSIIRGIVDTIQRLPTLQYSIIVDGTQDVSGVEQEAICIRYVDHDLVPHEDFIGLYEVSSTTGKELAQMVVDVLLRLNLPLSCLRGQTYDGAANMSGHTKGVQALLKEKQPLALYVHCGPHCSNLVTQTACGSSPVVSDALNSVHKLGTLYHQSGKYKTTFKEIAQSEIGSFKTLKPLCPTRWLVRMVAVRAVLDQYEEVILSLEAMATSGSSDTCITARGLLERFQKGHTYLGLLLASEALTELENLNRSLQSRTESVSGMLAAVECVKTTVRAKRSDESFHQLYATACDKIQQMHIETIQMPHVRRPPQRYTGPAAAFKPTSAEEHYRVEYFKVLDAIDVQLTKRFDQSSFETVNKLERTLIDGKVDEEVVTMYTELTRHTLEVQLNMFQLQFPSSTICDAANKLRTMPAEVRALFTQVEYLVRLLLVVPCSSAEAERSFSALRRLKTWLRTTMTQHRLNSVAVCHIHQEKLDEVNIEELCQAFISARDHRKNVFGAFT